jgi:16S rRNA (guanine(966)-N(2))-methyltransferase RsmD
LRIIAGVCKGRKLISPGDKQIRPTSDKVKGAVFSMAGERMPGAVVLDVFAGTGNLGLEALSRGAEYCYFCDCSADSIAIVRKNVALCGMEARAKLLTGGFEKTLSGVKRAVDVVFMDPPYHKELYVKCLSLIERNKILADDGLVITEHDAKLPFPDTMGGFVKLKEKRYGDVGVTLFIKS